MSESTPPSDSLEVEAEEAREPLAVWLPTGDGAILRSSVVEVFVEHVEGAFKGGATGAWSVYVRTTFSQDPVRLRPLFLDPQLLRWWVDQVFPGAFFDLMPPDNLGLDDPEEEADVDEAEPGAGGPLAVRAAWVPSAAPGPGGRLAGQIRGIGDSLGRGNAYEPPQGYRPPPGVHVAI